MSMAPFANTLFKETSMLVPQHSGMLPAGSLEGKDLSAEGADSDGGWGVCV